MVNRYGKALREINEAYKAMFQAMVEYTIERGASQSKMHRLFYHRFRELRRRGVARTEGTRLDGQL